MSEAGAKGGGKGGVIALAVLTLVAAGAGAAHGLQTYKIIESVKPADGAKEQAAAAPAAEPPSSGHGAPSAPAGGHGAPAPAAKAGEKVKLPSKLVTRQLQPLITNITMPPDLWVRLEGAIVYDQADVDDPEIMVSTLSGDLLAYLRTLTLREMQGADGLMFVRQDMKERVIARTQGKARDIIIQTLVVQ